MEGSVHSASRFIFTGTLGALAVAGAALTIVGKLPSTPGWTGAAVALCAAVAGLFVTPLTELIKQRTGAAYHRNATTQLLLKTGEVLVRALDRYDPIADLRIHPPTGLKEIGRLTPYVPRAIDQSLDDALRLGGLVVVEGNSAAGKSRSAFEALLRAERPIRRRPVVVPRDGTALRKFVESSPTVRNIVFWLDDLERFISRDGLDEGLLAALCPPERHDVLLVATLRSSIKLAFKGSASNEGSPRADYVHLLSTAEVIHLGRQLTKTERAEAERFRSDPRIAGALDNTTGAGLAEHIAAGPAAVERWLGGRNGANEVGSAIISAAVDCSRMGYFSPIPRSWLESMCVAYLEPRTIQRNADIDLDRAFEWATMEVQGASSCLIPLGDDNFCAFEYLVDYAQTDTNHSDIPGNVWHVVIDHIDTSDQSFLRIAAAAAWSGHPVLSNLVNPQQAGVISQDLLSDEQVFAVAKHAHDNHRCIACTAQTLGLDISRLVTIALNTIEQSLRSDEEPLTNAGIFDSLNIMYDLGDAGGPANTDTVVWKACQNIAPERLGRLGLVLLNGGPSLNGISWIRHAAMRGDTDAQSILQDQEKLEFELDEPRWRKCGEQAAKEIQPAQISHEAQIASGVRLAPWGPEDTLRYRTLPQPPLDLSGGVFDLKPQSGSANRRPDQP
jgi:hypothetical protein